MTLQAVPPSGLPDGTASAPDDRTIRIVSSGRLWLVTVDGVGRVGRFDSKSAAVAAARARARRGSHERIVVARPDGTVEELRPGRRR